MADTIAQALLDYFGQCPILADGTIHFDYLGEQAGYAIEQVSAENLVKTYTDGSKIKQVDFLFCSRDFYNGDLLQNIENISLFEALESWIEQSSRLGVLPQLPAGKQAVRVEALTAGYVVPEEKTESTARYQIECRLQYLTK